MAFIFYTRQELQKFLIMSIINGDITEKSGVGLKRQTRITMAVNVLICLAKRSQKINKMYIHIDIKSK